MIFVHFVERFISFLIVTPPSHFHTGPTMLLPLLGDHHLQKQPRVPLRSTLGYVLLRLQRDSMFGVNRRLLQSTQKMGTSNSRWPC